MENFRKNYIMQSGRLVFSHIISFLSKYEFNKCVERYDSNYRNHTFSCFDQFLCMIFAQITGRESLRDIEGCLRSMSNKLYHAGFRSEVSRSTLADANERRDFRIFSDFAQILIRETRNLYSFDQSVLDLMDTVYAFDSSTIALCLEMFPWAQFRRTKAGVKLHTLLDLKGNIPTFLHITPANVHDVNILDLLLIEPGAYHIMDRAYADFSRLYKIHQNHGYFVVRTKENTKFSRCRSRKVPIVNGLICDQDIRLTGVNTRNYYPEIMRRVRYFDQETDRRLTLFTNNFSLDAFDVAELYKSRWQVELFFKWIKQHLKIKRFFGQSENAVKTQIWIAVCTYLLCLIIKKKAELNQSPHQLMQTFSLTLFEKVMTLQELLNSCDKQPNQHISNQLELFDLANFLPMIYLWTLLLNAS